MSASRKRRRRLERERAKRPARRTRMPAPTRLAFVGAGVVLALAGAALLTHGAFSNEARLARVAGILILVGIVLIVVGAIGRY